MIITVEIDSFDGSGSTLTTYARWETEAGWTGADLELTWEEDERGRGYVANGDAPDEVLDKVAAIAMAKYA